MLHICSTSRRVRSLSSCIDGYFWNEERFGWHCSHIAATSRTRFFLRNSGTRNVCVCEGFRKAVRGALIWTFVCVPPVAGLFQPGLSAEDAVAAANLGRNSSERNLWKK